MLESWSEEPTGPDVAHLLRVSGPNGESLVSTEVSQGFTWPDAGYIEARQLKIPRLGEVPGLHGLLDGVGDWNQIPRHANATWQVLKVLRSEVKQHPYDATAYAPRGWVVYSGDAVGAMRIIAPIMARQAGISGAFCDDVVSNGALRGAINLDGGNAVAEGRQSTAIVANGGTATANKPFSIAAATGTPWAEQDHPYLARYSKAKSRAQAGQFGIAASFSKEGVARAGIGGAIFLIEWGEDLLGNPEIISTFASKVGENGIEPDRWYTLIYGYPIEVYQ